MVKDTDPNYRRIKMEKMTVTIEWEGQGPYGPQEIKEILESHYKNRLMVRRLFVA